MTKTGISSVNIEKLERDVWKTGQSVTNGKPWKVKDLGREIGASEGKSSQWMRVEMSSNTIHGHPISKAEYKNEILDIGWYPSFNKNGNFFISVIKDFDWENPVFKKEVREIEELLRCIKEVLARY